MECHNSMKELTKGSGYQMDFRAPRWDAYAVDICNRFFGYNQVSKILDNYKRARLTLADLYEDVFEYDIKYNVRLVDDPVYIAAFQSVREQFLPQVKIIPLTTGAVTTLPEVPKDKSPGLPWTQLGYRQKRDVYLDSKAMNTMRSEWHRIGEGRHHTLPDVQVFARSQISTKDKNKVRATWGYPTTVFLEEARFVYPYLDFLKSRVDDYPLGYGVEMINGGMGYIDAMYSRCLGQKRACMLDWKRFDKRVPSWLIRDAFRILREAFSDHQVLDAEGNVWDVNPVLTQRRWARMVNYFINTPFMMPDGRRFRKNGGVPSGSGWTNIIDSIVNAIVTRYCFFHTTGQFPSYDIYLGDDSVCMIEGDLDIEAFSSVASDVFGFELNQTKAYTTIERTNIQFLGYYNDYGTPFRSHDFLIASFCFPEKQDERTPTFTATRCLGQLWSTMNQASAARWFDMLKAIVNENELRANWLEEYLERCPSRLKFLQLYGFKTTGNNS